MLKEGGRTRITRRGEKGTPHHVDAVKNRSFHDYVQKHEKCQRREE